jgi:hypothetical protein
LNTHPASGRTARFARTAQANHALCVANPEILCNAKHSASSRLPVRFTFDLAGRSLHGTAGKENGAADDPRWRRYDRAGAACSAAKSKIGLRARFNLASTVLLSDH